MMVGSQVPGDCLGVSGLVEAVFFETDGESLDRAAGGRAHGTDHRRGVDAAGKKAPTGTSAIKRF